MDGVSLRPLLLGTAPTGPRRLYWNGRAMRDGPWKLVVPRKDGASPMLFDLDADLGETRNVAAEHPERVRRMMAALAAWRADVDADATGQPGP
jgi:arylsulfatase A-like enzyme